MNTLRQHRIARGLTQMKLGLRAHLTQDQICKLENGNLTPWRHQANALAIVLSIKADVLFPDGCKTKMDYNNGSATHNLEPAYTPPPEPEKRAVAYYTACPWCGAQMIYAKCYACAKDLEVREGAR